MLEGALPWETRGAGGAHRRLVLQRGAGREGRALGGAAGPAGGVMVGLHSRHAGGGGGGEVSWGSLKHVSCGIEQG